MMMIVIACWLEVVVMVLCLQAMWGLMVPGQKKGTVWVVDTVRSNQLPSLTNLFNN